MRPWALAFLTARALATCALVLAAQAPRLATAEEDPAYTAPARLLVLGADGRPLAGALVLPVADAVEGFALFDPDAPVAARTDADGMVRDLPPQQRIAAWTPGMAAVLVPRGPSAAIVRLTAAESTQGRVRLPRGQLAVRVPIVALPLEEGSDLGHIVRTDATGTFRFPALHRGRWRLLVRRGPHRFQTLGEATAGADLGDRRPRSDTAITGRLLDGDGTHREAVVDVGLRFRPLPGGGAPADAQLDVRTQADGGFRVGGLAPGVYEVLLTDAAWVFDQTPPRVQAEEGRVREVPTWYALRRRNVLGTVRDTENRPLRGARLKLVADPLDPGPPGGRGEPPRSVLTDPQGRFRIQGVTPSEGYRLMASHAGFSPWVSAPFRVDRGKDTDLKPVRLRRGWELRVRVRDGRGAPIVGASVFATAASRPSAIEDLEWTAMVRAGETDANGLLTLTDLPADDVIAFVRREGYLDAQAGVPYPRVSDHRSIDVDLQRASVMTVQVHAPEDGPQPPFRILATTRDGRRLTAAETDARGLAQFTDLLDTATDIAVTAGGPGPGVVLAEVENVVPGVERHLEVLLPVLRAVRGKVTGVDDLGPAPRIVVESLRFVAERERYVWKAVAGVRLDKAGGEVTFEVSGLPPGAYAVRAVQGGLDSEAVDVLLDGEDLEGVVLGMPAGARIAGAVLDGEGVPQIGVAVSLQRMHGEDPAPLRPRLASTDERGEFFFEAVAPGLWRIEAQDARRAPDGDLVRVLDGEVLVTRDLVLRTGGSIEGTIEDGEGRPLDGLHVHVRAFEGDETERIVRTDGEGRFRAPNLRPGAYLVRVDAGPLGRHASIEAVAEVAADESTRVDFRADQEGTIAGTVLRRGTPVQGAIVDLVHHPAAGGAARKRYRTQTGADGAFEVGGLPPGSYRIQLQSGAWRTQQDLLLPEGDRVQLDLVAYEGRLRGTVVTSAGDPVPGAHVTAWPATVDGTEDGPGTFLGEGRSDPSGAFVLRGLPVGTYTLSVSAAGQPPGRLDRADADLPGADYAVEVVLGRGGDVDLRVTDAADRGITGARIWLEDERGRALHRLAYVSGAAGRIRIEGVPPGSIRIRVYARGMGRAALPPIAVREGRSTPVAVTLRPGGSVRLIVTGDAGDPLGRARIDLVRAGSGEVLASRRPLSPIRLADSWGYVPATGVVDIPDLAEGSYVARVSAGRSYEPAEVPVAVRTGERSTVRITLAPALR